MDRLEVGHKYAARPASAISRPCISNEKGVAVAAVRFQGLADRAGDAATLHTTTLAGRALRALRAVTEAQLQASMRDDAQTMFSHASAAGLTQFADAASFVSMV